MVGGSYFNEYFGLLGGYLGGRIRIELWPQELLRHVVPSLPHRLSLGRVRSGQPDYLFSQVLQSVGDHSLVLARRLPEDDYVRFRIPDTNCPPLPEPDVPLDSGVSDEAEPERWIYSGVTFGDGWQFWLGSEVRTFYPCYRVGAPFRLEVNFSHSAIGGGFLVGPIQLSGLSNFRAYDFFFVSYGSVWIGAGYLTYAEVIEDSGLRPQMSEPAYGYGRSGWIVVWKGVADSAVLGHILVPIHSDRGMKQLVLVRDTNNRLHGWFRYYEAGDWQDVAVPVALGEQPAVYPIRFGRRVHFVEGSLTEEQQRRLLLLDVPFVMSSARTVVPSSLTDHVETLPFDFGLPVRVQVEDVRGFSALLWRSSDSIDALSAQAWGTDVPAVPRRYWQLRLVRSESAPYRELGERVDLMLTSEDTQQQDTGVPERSLDSVLAEIVPRNLGVYWSYGEFAASYYGATVQLPISLYTGLFCGTGWLGRMDVAGLDELWRAVPSQELKELLDRHDVCYLGLDDTDTMLYLPTDSVDSVGSRVSSVGLWVCALLKPYVHRWLGSPITGSVRQDIVNVVDAALKSLPGVRDARCQVLALQDTVVIRIQLWMYGVVERIAFDIRASDSGGIDVTT